MPTIAAGATKPRLSPMMKQILPADVAVVETTGGPASRPLSAEEARALGRVADKRHREFALGRQCAHRGLARLGAPAASLLPGPHGAPAWPRGYTGSITHCRGYCAAAVVSTGDYDSIGIDAEAVGPLADGVLEEIAFGDEIDWVTEQAGEPRGRLLFSAKESVYKAWFPLAARRLGFDEVRVEFDPLASTFAARLRVPGPLVGGEPLQTLSGRYRVSADLVLTATVVRRGER